MTTGNAWIVLQHILCMHALRCHNVRKLHPVTRHNEHWQAFDSHLYTCRSSRLALLHCHGCMRPTKNIGSLARQAHEIAPNLIIAGLGGFPDLGHHGLPLLLELGVNQADAHVLRHLVHRNELSCDGRHHHLAALLCSHPAHNEICLLCCVVCSLTNISQLQVHGHRKHMLRQRQHTVQTNTGVTDDTAMTDLEGRSG